MKLAIGSDEKTGPTDYVLEELQKIGHTLKVYGPMAGQTHGMARYWREDRQASKPRTDQARGCLLLDRNGSVHCGEQVPGVRAALCWDAETAKGARLWDDANALALSLRSTSPTVVREILGVVLKPAGLEWGRF